jgi:ABC-type phosphate transport system substrate-binding protein
MSAITTLIKVVRALVVGLTLSLTAGGAAADVVPVVGAKNPVATLSKNQIVDIFLGRSSRFPDGSPAVPLDHAEDSAARNEFYLSFAGKSPAQLRAHWSKIIFTGRGQPPREVANTVELKKRLAESPNAIGYLERSLVDASLKIVLSP